MTAYTPQHTVRPGELAARIYEGWLCEAVKEDASFVLGCGLKEIASRACDAAATFLTELRRRDPLTCELIHGDLPTDVEFEE